jgi:hypothetical protein
MTTTIEATQYISADVLPGVMEERQRVREEAWAVMSRRRELLVEGGEDELPPVIDALSTAERVIEAKQAYGHHSDAYIDRLAGLELDCLRLVAEWYRKLRPEYFPPTRHVYDKQTSDFYSHGLSIRQMTENAIRPIHQDTEEEARRVNELVENETPVILRNLGTVALGGVGIRTISECTDKAVADYNSDDVPGRSRSGYGGYVPEIQKVMIREMRIGGKNKSACQVISITT